ncbi:MAG TPA: hypothetical protein VMB79_11105, partial [Jatrophihabitans sp.]|nr:hypothetical protein [Jatrophihabitans sp.]
MSGTGSAKAGRHALGRSRRRPRGILVLGRSALVLGLVALGQLVLLPGTAQAAGSTFTVSTTADIAANAGACGNSGITTPPSPLSLREATCLANNVGGTVTIVIPAGHYTLTSGELAPGKASGQTITITGAGSASTIIDGNNASRVLNIDGGSVGGVNASISGVTITKGHDTTYGGAGILDGSYTSSTSDSLSISNSVISNNTAVGSSQPGGGIQMYGGQLTITNTTISGNTSNVEGSGVYYQATGTASPEGLTATGSTFSGNNVANTVTSGASGGALALVGVAGTTYTVTGDQFTGNSASSNGSAAGVGAAIFQPSGSLTASQNTFTGNTVTGSGSAGPAVYSSSTASLHYNRITGNSGSGSVATTTSMDVGENWWGCNAGPNQAGCDSTSGATTNAGAYLKLVATASPAHVVGPNGTATISADLTTDSLGATVGGSNLGAFETLPVSFADPPGDATVTLSTGAHTAAMASGHASIDYHSNTTVGPDNDTVTLDNATVTVTLEVDEAPTITSANSANFDLGSAGSFTVTTTGYPTAALTESGTLPAGVTFTDNGDGTATLAGTPTASGTYPVTLTASNGYAPNATQTLTIHVGQPPAFTSSSTATFVIGQAGSFTVTTSGVPTVSTITESGSLPAGVTFTDNGN